MFLTPGQGLSRKTRNLHRDNVWLLGGEIIRDINDTSKLRKLPKLKHTRPQAPSRGAVGKSRTASRLSTGSSLVITHISDG